MKKLATRIIILLISLASLQAFSQAPEGMKYQAVARNIAGVVLANTDVTFDISIMHGDAEGPAVYHETHSAVTNETGLVSLVIGQGETGDDFSAIDWSSGPYFLSVEVNGIPMGTSQLLSVPYSLYSREAENVFSGDYNDLENTPDLSAYIQTETDPLFDASVAKGITSEDTARWNEASASKENSGISYEAGLGIDITGDVISADVPDPDQPVPIIFQGGIIYVHPLLIKSVEWGAFNFLIGVYSETDGIENTEKLAAVQVDPSYAARVCSDLTDFGYDDWYLPSRYEIDAIYKQSYLLKNINYSSHYWSSTESNKDMAWKVNFYNGASTTDYKNRVNTLICVRKDK
jgi:hypothetical protein